MDAPGHTGFTAGGASLFCPQLLPHCNHPNLRFKIHAKCPETCGLCDQPSPSPSPPAGCSDAKASETGFTLNGEAAL